MSSSEAWPDARLDELRRQGDVEMDMLLDELRTLDEASVRRLYDDFVRAQLDFDHEVWPALVHEWWDTPQPLPGWVNQEQVRRAILFSQRWLPELLTSYLLGSLPTAYAGEKGVLVMSRISLLASQDALLRRVLETLLFVLRVNEEEGLRTGGTGFQLARKTRVFHGLVRVMIEDFSFDRRVEGGIGAPWESDNGVPLNQEDLLGTLWTFAITPLELLERLGARLPDEDKDAVVHLWCVVGHLLGIGTDASPPLLPMTYADATRCWARIQDHQFASSPEGRQLTQVLIERCRKLIPIPLLRPLPAAAIYDNLGSTIAGLVGVRRPGPARHLLHLSGAIFRISLRVPGGGLLRAPLRHFLKRFTCKWLMQERLGSRPSVRLPEAQRRCLVPLYVRPTARKSLPIRPDVR